jgi:hypothetical protein
MNEVAYFFYKEGTVRIPVYDRPLFDRIRQNNIGFWDRQNRQFILSTEYVHRAVITHLFYGATLVRVNEEAGGAALGAIAWNEVWSEKYYLPPSSGAASPDENTAVSATDAEEPCFPAELSCKLKTELAARKYSPKTIHCYLYFNKQLCETVKKNPAEISSDDIKRFLAILNDERGLSASSMNLAISALKFFYRRVLERNIVQEQRRPRQDKTLPAVLGKPEVRRMLDGTKNLKHRLLLMLTYLAGLRVSEVVSFKKTDIDICRKTILIR